MSAFIRYQWILFFFKCFSRAETKSAQTRGGSPSSFKKSLLKRRPLGSFPMKLCTYSVPWSFTAMAYFRGFTQDCRQKGTLESPMVCLRKTTKENSSKHVEAPPEAESESGNNAFGTRKPPVLSQFIRKTWWYRYAESAPSPCFYAGHKMWAKSNACIMNCCTI